MLSRLRSAGCVVAVLAACSGSEPSPVVEQVIVTPADPILGFPATVQLTAQALDGDGDVVSGVSFIWSSSSAAIATVSGTGLVTSRAEGTATVGARVGDVEGSTRIAVQVPVAALTVEPGATTIPAYGTRQFAVTATGTDGEPIGPAGTTWSVSDPDLAAVDAEGIVTALAEGDVLLTATFRGVSASADVSIGPPEVAEVEIWEVGHDLPEVRVSVIPLGASEELRAISYDVRGQRLEGGESRAGSRILDGSGRTGPRMRADGRGDRLLLRWAGQWRGHRRVRVYTAQGRRATLEVRGR